MSRRTVASVLTIAAIAAACGSSPSAGPSPDQPGDRAVHVDDRSDHLDGRADGDDVDPSEDPPDSRDEAPPATSTPPADEPVGVRYGTLTERTLDRDADGRNATAAIDGLNRFAVDVYRHVAASEEGNVVVSPYSITFALGMVHAGAEGATEDEMSTVLHIDPDVDWHEGINAYDLSLDARTAGSPTTWTSGNKVWAQPGMPWRDDYLDVLTGDYGSPLAEAEFATDAEAQRLEINDWVAGKTGDLIPELWAPGSFDSNTRMVLVNAVALDAAWEFPFDPARSGTTSFELLDGSFVGVDVMRYDEYLPSAWSEEWQAVELPYGGGALSMVVIVPTDWTSFEAGLTTESIESILGSIEDGGIHLTIPKWSARTAVTLNDTLAEMGMPTAFSDAADFSGMVDGGGLVLSKVVHEAFVEVDEEGTRAAAATSGAMEDSHGPTITIDRPFLYLIRDRNADATLFVGRVLDPRIPAD